MLDAHSRHCEDPPPQPVSTARPLTVTSLPRSATSVLDPTKLPRSYTPTPPSPLSPTLVEFSALPTIPPLYIRSSAFFSQKAGFRNPLIPNALVSRTVDLQRPPFYTRPKPIDPKPLVGSPQPTRSSKRSLDTEHLIYTDAHTRTHWPRSLVAETCTAPPLLDNIFTSWIHYR